MMDGCPICAKHHGTGPLVAPVVWADGLVVVSHLPATDEPTFLGHLLVETRRHAAHLDGLTADEAMAVGHAVRCAAVGLRAELAAEFVHSAVINQRIEHFHQHVYARHPGTPEEYAWHQVDEWPDAPSGRELEVAHLCSRLRGYFTDQL